MKYLCGFFLIVAFGLVMLQCWHLHRSERYLTRMRLGLGELPEVVTVAREQCPCGPKCECCRCEREASQ